MASVVSGRKLSGNIGKFPEVLETFQAFFFWKVSGNIEKNFYFFLAALNDDK